LLAASITLCRQHLPTLLLLLLPLFFFFFFLFFFFFFFFFYFYFYFFPCCFNFCRIQNLLAPKMSQMKRGKA
jgi:hypothetical protein